MGTSPHPFKELDGVLERIHNGSEEALGELMLQWRDVLERLAFRLLSDDGLACDVVQEALIAVWASRRQYRPERPAWPWIARIIRNKCHAVWRERGSRRKDGILVEVSIEYAEFLPARMPSPHLQNEQRELLELARERIENLPPTLREVVKLSLFEELTEEEIANLLGVAKGTVKSRKHRGLQRVRSELRKAQEGTSHG